MAYTATVTKGNVTKNLKTGIFNVSIRCVVNDGSEDVFDVTATGRHNPSSPNLAATRQSLINQIKKKWDKFLAEKSIHDAAALDAMVNQIQENANTYMNS